MPISNPSHLQFTPTPTPLLTPHAPIALHFRHHRTLMMRSCQQSTLVELLRARRHVDGRIPREEVDGLETDFQHFAGHHGEVFDAWDLGSGGVSWGLHCVECFATFGSLAVLGSSLCSGGELT
jgi:hypothetical protein